MNVLDQRMSLTYQLATEATVLMAGRQVGRLTGGLYLATALAGTAEVAGRIIGVVASLFTGALALILCRFYTTKSFGDKIWRSNAVNASHLLNALGMVGISVHNLIRYSAHSAYSGEVKVMNDYFRTRFVYTKSSGLKGYNDLWIPIGPITRKINSVAGVQFCPPEPEQRKTGILGFYRA